MPLSRQQAAAVSQSIRLGGSEVILGDADPIDGFVGPLAEDESGHARAVHLLSEDVEKTPVYRDPVTIGGTLYNVEDVEENFGVFLLTVT